MTADRGFGQASVDDDLAKLGVDLVAILGKRKMSQARQAIEAADDFVEFANSAPARKAESPR